MSLIAEITIQTPLLGAALARVPDLNLRTESIHLLGDDTAKGLVWAWGDDFDSFERGLDDDPTVEEHVRLAAVDDRRLYRITYTEAGRKDLTYPTLAEYDCSILQTTGSYDGLELRIRFPSRDALVAYREACRERDIPFHLESLFWEEQVAGDGGRITTYGVTDRQREALVRAFEMGYFDVPRRTTLDEVADEFDITNQAVSTRLRRGLQNLLKHTLVE